MVEEMQTRFRGTLMFNLKKSLLHLTSSLYQNLRIYCVTYKDLQAIFLM